MLVYRCRTINYKKIIKKTSTAIFLSLLYCVPILKIKKKKNRNKNKKFISNKKCIRICLFSLLVSVRQVIFGKRKFIKSAVLTLNYKRFMPSHSYFIYYNKFWLFSLLVSVRQASFGRRKFIKSAVHAVLLLLYLLQ